MTDYRDGKWHGWNGGECPVSELDKVEVMLLSGGGGAMVTDCPKELRWTHGVSAADIIAFRVTEKHEGPKTIWVNEYGGYNTMHRTETDARFSASTSVEKPTRIAVEYREVKK